MTDIKRYEMEKEYSLDINVIPVEEHDGSFVRYDDHAAIVAAKDARISKLEAVNKSVTKHYLRVTDERNEALYKVTALQEQVRALAAENAALTELYRKSVTDLDGMCFEMGMMRGEKSMEYPAPETPATDSALREIRAQSRAEGIHFAANRILAAWESGFIDDTAAAAYDISGAVLSAVEFLPNADEGEFKREYADEVRARIRAGRS